jgi:hypothetical protein
MPRATASKEKWRQSTCLTESRLSAGSPSTHCLPGLTQSGRRTGPQVVLFGNRSVHNSSQTGQRDSASTRPDRLPGGLARDQGGGLGRK